MYTQRHRAAGVFATVVTVTFLLPSGVTGGGVSVIFTSFTTWKPLGGESVDAAHGHDRGAAQVAARQRHLRRLEGHDRGRRQSC
jgi:hypothetical protein